jgi:hypothetical protein
MTRVEHNLHHLLGWQREKKYNSNRYKMFKAHKEEINVHGRQAWFQQGMNMP